MKKIRMITKILAIILLCLISFVGIYTQEKNQIKNQVKDYSLGMDLKGGRVLNMNVSDKTETVYYNTEGKQIADPTSNTSISKDSYTSATENVNKDGVINTDNIEKAKKILEKRLKLYGAEEYNVRTDTTTGNVVIEMTENTNTDTIVSNVTQTGDFKVIDSQTEEILMTNDDIKSSTVLYNTTTSGTVVYLDIEFTKDGAKKLEDISKTYVKSSSTTDTNTTTNTTSDNTTTTTDTNTSADNTNTTSTSGSTSTASTEKKIKMTVDGTTLVETSFDTVITDGKLQMSMGSATTDTTTLQKNLQSASSIAYTLDTGKLPIVYTTGDNQFIYADSNINFNKIAIALVCAFALVTLILIIVFKLNGLLAAISYAGLASIIMLIIRYTNVTITIESISALAIIAIINLGLLISILNEIKVCKQENIEKSKLSKLVNLKFKTLYIALIPAAILTVSVSFATGLKIYSFGFMMFWGLALIVIYNFIVTKNLLKIKMVK